MYGMKAVMLHGNTEQSQMEQGDLTARDMGARGEAAEEPEPLWFVQMMKLYPKQENRTAAAREAHRLAPDAQLQVKILQAVKFLKASEKWQKGFAPDAKNFLRDKRWKDAEGMAGYSSSVNVTGNTQDTQGGSQFDVEKHTNQKAMDLPSRYGPTVKAPPPLAAKPGGARQAMKDGVIAAWKAKHPGEEPPAALLENPVAYVTGLLGAGGQRKAAGGQGIDPDAARKQAEADLEYVKAKMNATKETD